MNAVFPMLVGASFSLWRAAFLSHINQTWPDMISSEKNLLEILLETNTVSFRTDLKCRDWVFGYYLTSAFRRLSTARASSVQWGPNSRRVRENRPALPVRHKPPAAKLWGILRETLVRLTTELNDR